MILRKSTALFSFSLLASMPMLAWAATPPSTGVLFTADKAKLTELKSEGATPLLVEENGATVLKATFPAGKGYPALVLPMPADGWDLSKYAGVQVDVTNTGTEAVRVALRVDNAGDWRKNPFNTEAVTIKPGATQTIKVTFGKSYGGNPGYALDSSKVSALRVFANDPKAETTVVISNLKAFGTASSAPLAPVTTVAALAPTVGQLFDVTKADAADFKTDNTSVSTVGEGANKTLTAEFNGGNGYPAFDFPSPAGGWNLSKYAGVQVDVTNKGTATAQIALRVDNAGDWRKNPFNTESVYVAPGQTKTIKVTFGKSYGGNPGYALDATKVSNLKIFAVNPKQNTTVAVSNLKPFGEAGAATVTTASNSTPAQGQNLNAPPISGELLTLTNNVDLSTFQANGTDLSVENGKLKVLYKVGENYPNVWFPVPKGGWNLSAFAGVQVDITNLGTTPVTPNLRVDNAGNWKDNPWNTEGLRIAPGETKTIQVTFGKGRDGAPTYPLDPTRISGMQVFLINPKQESTLLMSNLKAFGSGGDRADSATLSTPADRNKPVTPPAWLGTRPPVDGNWVQTLNENFDGTELNSKIWSADGDTQPLDQYTNRYVKENAIVGGGVLRIRAEKKFGHHYNNPKLKTREYTTAEVVTYDKWRQAYGYFECRVKLPTTRGLWPAFWMMPDRGPGNGDRWQRQDTKNGGMEFDILEYLTEWGPGRNNVAVHWDGYWAEHKQWGTSNVYHGPTPDGWHNFGMLWEPGKLTWFIDGVKKVEWVNERVGHIPAYLILCTQMGGWAGKNVDDAKLPDDFIIDYVRVWQLKERMKP